MGVHRLIRRSSGFTIIELIVVITVIAILAGIVVVSYGAWRTSVRSAAVKSDLIAASATMESAANTSTGYPLVDPTFTPSSGVTITFTLKQSKEYCIDGVSSDDAAITYYLYSKTKTQGALAGTCGTRPDLTPPAAPGSVSIASSTGSTATVNWTSVGDALSYVAQCASDPGFIYNPQQTTVTQSAGTVVGTVAGLSSGTFYCRVKAVNAKGASAWSAITSGVATCPIGFIIVPGSATYGTSDFCVMKYEAKQVNSTTPISQAAGAPWTSISQTNAITYSANVTGCSGCHLITEAEWLTIAQNVLNVSTNWSGGAVGSGFIYSGHTDAVPSNALSASTNDGEGYNGTGQTAGSNQRRTLTLSNGEVIWDLAGNVQEWTQGTITTGQPGGSGYASREWNAVGGTGTVSPNPFPVFGTAGASAWTSTQRIGTVYSNTAETGLRGFIRGGDYGAGVNGGIYNLILSGAPAGFDPARGFRVAK